jgi:hypothetical protein
MGHVSGNFRKYNTGITAKKAINPPQLKKASKEASES